ncbi:hypothetical protein BDV96DRAFT_604605 [Lophiotrema nucula]|uniref:F-box domain-containing protein n=1 Tax=Lophiotrema nucula TaxID=690887 RepID=A0A6A5YUB5_9PLEO|nr:hypothetical protein BDV96DRAFT_604605 [Lophiotrema nucula]
MSASLFSILPPELICQVFEGADDFSVVAALAQTARIFYNTWQENATSICRAVAPRVISNLNDAERLLDAQEEAEPVSQSQGSREQKSYNRAKRLLCNARCTSAASNNWADLCHFHDCWARGDEQQVRPSELARFEHAFYCVWTIGIMGKTPHLQDQASAFLDDCSPQELFRLNELRDYARHFNDNEFGSSGLDFNDEVWMTGCNLVSKRWGAYQQGKGGMPAPDNTEVMLCFYAFFDHTQRYLDFI